MPTTAIVRPYEAIYIVDPDLTSEQIDVIRGKYRQLVESRGGTIEKIDTWERRKLAYEIDGRTEGIYIVMQFSAVGEVEHELRRIFQISEDQFRYMIIKREGVDELLNGREPAQDEYSGHSRHGGHSRDSHAAPTQVAPPSPVAEAPVLADAPAVESAPEGGPLPVGEATPVETAEESAEPVAV